MPRRPKKVFQTRILTPAAIAYLSDDDTAVVEDNFTLWCYRAGMPGLDHDPEPKELWDQNQDEFLPAFIAKNPGRRPLAWWHWSAPRWNDPYEGIFFHGTLCEPRQRIGGIGTPSFEVLAYVPHFDKGIPTGWVSKFEEDYYTGRVKDIPGHKVERNNREGDFKGVAIDPNDPPVFESETAYLLRNGLLTPAEKKHLALHPELMEPEVIKGE